MSRVQVKAHNFVCKLKLQPIKCLHCAFLHTRDMLVLYVSYVSHQHFYNTCHITLRSHVYELISLSGVTHGQDGSCARDYNTPTNWAVLAAIGTFFSHPLAAKINICTRHCEFSVVHVLTKAFFFFLKMLRKPKIKSCDLKKGEISEYQR